MIDSRDEVTTYIKKIKLLNFKNILTVGSFEKASILFFITGFVVNILHMLFQLVMVRFLVPDDFGTLNTLLAVVSIVTIPAATIRTVITKFTANYHGLNQYNKISRLLRGAIKRILIIVVPLTLFFIFANKYVSSFLQISSAGLFIIVGLSIIISYILPIPMGGLYGLQRFVFLSINIFTSAAIKLGIGFLLIMQGFRVMGALIAFFSDLFVSFLLSLFPLKDLLFQNGRESFHFGEVYTFFLPVTIVRFCFMALTNMDLILVKHFFTPLDTGYYSIAQIIGKIILFLPGAIIAVMFPMTSNLSAQGKDTLFILNKGLLYTGLLCLGASVLCLMFPGYILKLITGKVYPESIPLVRLFSLSMVFFAMTSVYIDYLLSVHNLSFMVPIIMATIAQTLLIILFHYNLIYVLYIQLFLAIALLLILIVLSSKKQKVPGDA